MNTPIIELKNISYAYNDEYVLANFSGIIFSKENIALMAPSGTGKTTLLFLIAGLLQPQAGSIAYPLATPKFSMVFQENRLLEDETVFSNIIFVNPNVTENTIISMIQKTNLASSPDDAKDFCNKKGNELSGGEKRRVALIRALLAEYDILLLDEPFTGLDDATKFQILQLLKTMTKEKTVILTTHNPTDASTLDCRVIALS